MRLPRITSSTIRTDRSRPTFSGTTASGKTTVPPRSGSTGNASGISRRPGDSGCVVTRHLRPLRFVLGRLCLWRLAVSLRFTLLFVLWRGLVIHVSHLAFACVFRKVMRSRPWS